MNQLTPPHALDAAAIAELFNRGDNAALAAEAGRWIGRNADAAQRDTLTRLALACAAVGKVGDAERLLRQLLAFEPADLGHRVNLGVLLLQSARYAEAVQILGQCLRDAPNDPEVALNYALCEFALGNYRVAGPLLEQLLKLWPDDGATRLYLARCLAELGRRQAAWDLLRSRPLQVAPLRERYELAYLYASLDRFEEAERSYRDILQQEPGEDPAKINLAALLERANRREEARGLLADLSDAARESTLYWLLQARLQGVEQPQQLLESLARAEQALPADVQGAERDRLQGDIAFERGQALDRLGRSEEAFAAFTRGNQLARDRFRHNVGYAKDQEGFKLADSLEIDPVVAQARRWPGEGEAPVFLVGFPRSGTTLLDQMLDAHPQLQVLEEKPALEAVVAALNSHPEGYPKALLQLGQEDFGQLRQVYWNTVSQYLERRPGTRLVDKYPLNLSRLQLGMTLFPQARWIFALRHPCDVVLSCFMQNFRFTEATRGFWSLPETAALYAQFMSLWQAQRARLQPDCFELRYESLVENLEGEARRMMEFLGLPWDDAILHYYDHARTRRISTPSYRQVVQAVYGRARGRWTQYRAQFAELQPLLEPFVTAFGYPPLQTGL